MYSFHAESSIDYQPVTSSDIILNDGDYIGLIPITLKADDLPELQERFTLGLSRVELIGAPPINPGNIPQLGKYEWSLMIHNSIMVFINICAY